MQEELQTREGGSNFESALNEAVEAMRRTLLLEHERIMAREASPIGEVLARPGPAVAGGMETGVITGTVPLRPHPGLGHASDTAGQSTRPRKVPPALALVDLDAVPDECGDEVHLPSVAGVGVGADAAASSVLGGSDLPESAEGPAGDLMDSDGDEEAGKAVGGLDPGEPFDFSLQSRLSSRSVSSGSLGPKLRSSDTAFNVSDLEVSAKNARKEHLYDLCIAVLIISNVVWMNIEAELDVDNTVSLIVSVAFCALFIGDLGWRVRRDGRLFVTGRHAGWNVFDLVIVSLMTSAIIARFVFAENHAVQSLITIRIIRLTRLLRLVALMKELNSYHDVRVLVSAIKQALPVLVWVMLLSACLVYVFGLGLTQAASGSCGTGDAENEALCRWFGSVPRACLSLYLAMYDGILWGELLDPIEALGGRVQALLVLQMSFLKIVFVNMVFASLVGIWQQISHAEQEMRLDTVMEERDTMMNELADLFMAVDVNNSGAISLDELEMAFEDPKIVPYFVRVKINDFDLRSLFNILDEEHEGAVDINEFVTGMQWLRGNAREIDVVMIQKKCDKILRRLDQREHRGSTSARGQHETAATRSQPLPATPGGGGGNAQQELFGFQQIGLQRMFTKKQESMDKPEMRAMTLHELRQVRQLISDLCLKERWVDMFTRKALSPETVNLYHLVQNYIAPKTAPAGLVLHFPGCPAGNVGARVLQYGAEDQHRGEGELLEQTREGIRVQLLRGDFSCSMPRLLVDDVDFGQPTRIRAPISISYKELISSTPTRPTWFCSHWWGESVFDFVTSCEEHARLRGLDSSMTSYWVCGYANRQHSLAQEIGGDLEQTTFRKAMNASRGVLLHLDKDAVALTRIWCDFEIFCTVNDGTKEFDIVTRFEGFSKFLTSRSLPKEPARARTLREAAFPVSLLVKGMSTKLQDGAASKQEDHDAILDYISHHGPGGDNKEENLRLVNGTLQAVFAKSAWPQAVKRGMVNDFDTDNPGTLRLPDVLRADTQRHKLEMSLEHIDKLTDAEVKHLAAALPPNLSELALSFEGCRHVSNPGLEALGSQLQHLSSIRKLNLDFLGCHNIGDRGLAALAKGLPGQLQELELHFDRCHAINQDGVVALAQRMPQCVKTFRGTFKGTGVDRNFASLREIRSFARNKSSKLAA